MIILFCLLGHDVLAKCCAKYYAAGARFAKWRAVLKIGPNESSQLCIDLNAHGLACYTIICQENGLVLIVKPEILVNWSHDIDRCAYCHRGCSGCMLQGPQWPPCPSRRNSFGTISFNDKIGVGSIPKSCRYVGSTVDETPFYQKDPLENSYRAYGELHWDRNMSNSEIVKNCWNYTKR